MHMQILKMSIIPIEKVNTCVCGQTYLIEEGDKGLCPDCVEEETGDE